MTYNPEKHHRHSIRLKGYDYSQPGAYFITICTQDRACLFGEVVDGEIRLNPLGEIVREEWLKAAQIRPYVRLHEEEFVVMPNHIHGIIWIINDAVGRRGASPLPNDRGDPNRIPSAPLLANSNPPPPNASTPCEIPPAPLFGNATITNTSSAARRR